MQTLRRRDLLLSLKYSTMEACFSVPMLNLTLPLFPFVIAFAVQELGWSTSEVGWATALPHLCNCVQPLLMTLLVRRFSTFQVLALSYLLGALPWGLAGLLPWFQDGRDVAFIVIMLVATLANSIASVAWSSAMSELVPPQISGRYYGRRNLIFGLWTLLVIFGAGYFVGNAARPLEAFALLFAAAGLARLTALLFLNRMKFPRIVHERRPGMVSLKDCLAVLRERNYIRLALFIGLWGLLINASLPFYTVFLVNNLGLGLDMVVRLTTLASLGGLITIRAWGGLCDQFGNRPVLHVCALVWASTATLMWLFAGTRWHWQLYVGYLLIGAVTAGFQLCQFNLMLKLAPSDRRPASVAVFLAFTSLLTALGPVLGGHALTWLPERVGTLFQQPITGFHLLFALAGLGGLVVTRLASRVREPEEQPVETVWRAMQGMRAFNPMLSVPSVGELLLTPRGLLSLGRRSIRVARRQARALSEVGEEIIEGGRDAMRRRRPPRE